MFWYRPRILLVLSFTFLITLISTKLFFRSDDVEEFPLLDFERNSHLFGCGAPSDELLPQTYLVHLRTGSPLDFSEYTIDQHFQTIKYDLTAKIQHMNSSIWRSRLVYTASKVSPSLLHQIRSDLHVDRVFCVRNPSVPYRAPMNEPGDPADWIGEEFMIALMPHHSIEEHSKIVGTNMSALVDYRYSLDQERFWFLAKGVDDALLECIRGDEGVEFIERNTKVYMID